MITARIKLLEVEIVLIMLALSGCLVGCSSDALVIPLSATLIPTSSALPSVTPNPTSTTLPSVTSIPTSSIPLSATQRKPTEITRLIAFESLGQGDSYTATLEAPTMFVAGNMAETVRFIGWVNDADVARRIQQVDFNAAWIVAIFSGKMGSSGYGITIREISTDQATMRFTADLTEPAPGQNVSDVISYPYHIILLPREGLNVLPGTIWAVYTQDGTLLTETRYP